MKPRSCGEIGGACRAVLQMRRRDLTVYFVQLPVDKGEELRFRKMALGSGWVVLEGRLQRGSARRPDAGALLRRHDSAAARLAVGQMFGQKKALASPTERPATITLDFQL